VLSSEAPPPEWGETIVSDAKDEEFQFEPFEEQPEGGVAPLDEGPDALEDFSPADPLAEEPNGDLAPEVLEEEGEDAFPAEEALSAAAAEQAEEEPAGKEKKEKRKKGGGLIGAVTNASPFTVMLVLAFFALLLGILCLLGELGRYEYDIKAEKAKRGSALAPALHRVAPSNTLAACPTAEKLNFSAIGGAPASGSV
jgi:hypothetical protein